jgi:hypothetical protein
MRDAWHRYRHDRRNGRPPWWVWFEPPRWWPRWLHLRACTFCRGRVAYIDREEATDATP